MSSSTWIFLALDHSLRFPSATDSGRLQAPQLLLGQSCTLTSFTLEPAHLILQTSLSARHFRCRRWGRLNCDYVISDTWTMSHVRAACLFYYDMSSQSCAAALGRCTTPTTSHLSPQPSRPSLLGTLQHHICQEPVHYRTDAQRHDVHLWILL